MRNKMKFTAQFDKHNPNWSPVAEYNAMFLRAQQNYANDRLFMRDFLTLNDVYDQLGLERTREGMVYGWIRGDQIDFFNPTDVGASQIPLTFKVRDIYTQDEEKHNG